MNEALLRFWQTPPSVANVTDVWTLVVIVGLGLITVVTRSFFFMSQQSWSLPSWAERGLRYAPIAALSAVIAPEIVMRDAAVINTLADARIWGALAGSGYFFWRRRSNPHHSGVLGTIVAGIIVFLPLRLGLGW
jgi:branched-subunit amino acid transport protein